MRKSSLPCSRERGFTLVELAITCALAATLLVLSLSFFSRQLEYAQARTQADQLKVLNAAIANYEVAWFTQLVTGAPIAGVNHPMSPTVSELQTLGYLDKSFSPVNLYSGSYAAQLKVTPTGCTVTTCLVFGLTYLTTPLRDSTGQVNASLLGEATLEAGGDAAVSTSLDAAHLTGLNGSWVVDNPLGATVGILAMRSGYGTQNLNQYLPRSGALPLTGDLDMAGQNINNAATLTAGTVSTGTLTAGNASVSGTLTTGNVVTPVGGTVQIGNSVVSGDSANTVLSQTGGVVIQGPSGNPGSLSTGTLTATAVAAQGAVQVGGDVTASGDLSAQNLTTQGSLTANGSLVPGWFQEGTSCASSGAIARRANDGVPLTCQNGTWVQLGACSALTDASLSACPAGQVGTILMKRDYQCATPNGGGSWGPWYQAGNTCKTQTQAGW